MKKKTRKFLFFSILSFCCLSFSFLFLNEKKEAVGVSADTEITLSHWEYDNTFVYYGNSRVYLTMSLDYKKVYDVDGYKYYFSLYRKYYLRTWNTSDDLLYYLYYGSWGTNFEITSRGPYSSEEIAVNTAVDLKLNSVDFTSNYQYVSLGLDLYVGSVLYNRFPAWSMCKMYKPDHTVSTSTTVLDLFKADSLNRSLISSTVTYPQEEYDLGYSNGYSAGYDDGYNIGFNNGSSVGYDSGYSQGYTDAVNYYEQELLNSYNSGYSQGYTDGLDVDGTAVTIMSGIFQVALVPINFFLGMFNFEILGINLSSVVQALFTIAVTIILIKVVMGRKGD